MFGDRFFALRFFPDRYFGEGGGVPAPVGVDGPWLVVEVRPRRKAPERPLPPARRPVFVADAAFEIPPPELEGEAVRVAAADGELVFTIRAPSVIGATRRVREARGVLEVRLLLEARGRARFSDNADDELAILLFAAALDD